MLGTGGDGEPRLAIGVLGCFFLENFCLVDCSKTVGATVECVGEEDTTLADRNFGISRESCSFT